MITYARLLKDFGYAPREERSVRQPDLIMPPPERTKLRTKAQQQTLDAMRKLRSERKAMGLNACGKPHGGKQFVNKKYL